MSTFDFEKADTTEDTIDEIINYLNWIMAKLDSKNVKRLNTNETSIKSANGETYINGPILEMYDSAPILRLRQGLDVSTSLFIFELFNNAGTKTVGTDSDGNATFSGTITASEIVGGTITIGTNNDIFKADSNGIYLGHAAFADAPFSVNMQGHLKAIDAEIQGIITGSSFNTFEDGQNNYIQLDSTGLKGYEKVGTEWELNGLIISSVSWADTYWYYKGTKYLGIEYHPVGVSFRNYNSAGTISYEFLFSANGTTYPNGDWDFQYCNAINNLITSTDGAHNHGIPNGTIIATSSDGINIDGFETFVESGAHSHTVEPTVPAP